MEMYRIKLASSSCSSHCLREGFRLKANPFIYSFRKFQSLTFHSQSFSFVRRNIHQCISCHSAYKGIQEVEYLTHSTLLLCSVHGHWSPWVGIGQCPVSCVGSIWREKRICNNPPPLRGGRKCAGSWTRLNACNAFPCPSECLTIGNL